jgi:hypothetical protein
MAPAIIYNDCYVWATKYGLEGLKKSCCAAGDTWYEALEANASSKVIFGTRDSPWTNVPLSLSHLCVCVGGGGEE